MQKKKWALACWKNVINKICLLIIYMHKQDVALDHMYIQNVNNKISIILLWVDNILIASKTEEDLMKIKAKLNSRSKMTDLLKLSWFLGIQFECKSRTIEMNHYLHFSDYCPHLCCHVYHVSAIVRSSLLQMIGMLNLTLYFAYRDRLF